MLVYVNVFILLLIMYDPVDSGLRSQSGLDFLLHWGDALVAFLNSSTCWVEDRVTYQIYDIARIDGQIAFLDVDSLRVDGQTILLGIDSFSLTEEQGSTTISTCKRWLGESQR